MCKELGARFWYADTQQPQTAQLQKMAFIAPLSVVFLQQYHLAQEFLYCLLYDPFNRFDSMAHTRMFIAATTGIFKA